MQHGGPCIKMKNYLFGIVQSVFLLIIVTAFRTAGVKYPREPLPASQLVIVITNNWNDIHAKLYAFEQRKGTWHLQFSFAVVVGERGMAMGEGMRDISITDAPQKKEGDMKSPAGIFFLGPAFGYASKSTTDWMHMSYMQATDTLICVDDPQSVVYNELIKSDTVKKDWSSHENMHRNDHDYEWGVFVQYNSHPVKAGKGSCIFLHIWDDAGIGTAGCTAMDEKNMMRLLHWIRADKRPTLVQFPEAVYKRIKVEFLLPDL
jgi:L,D-peptidoglycan transpeptidase YkuD (ErfK/YbiS/YcfS/YnhG family)